MSSLGSILQPPEESSGLSGWAGVLAIIVAYILAFVLSGIWEIPATLRRVVNREPKRDVESLRFDFVNQRLPKAGAWLTKLYAETTLTQVLIIGWLASLAINLHFLVIRRWDPFPTVGLVERVWLCVGLLVGIIGAAVARSCIARTRDRTRDNLWDLLQEQLVIAEIEQPAR